VISRDNNEQYEPGMYVAMTCLWLGVSLPLQLARAGERNEGPDSASTKRNSQPRANLFIETNTVLGRGSGGLLQQAKGRQRKLRSSAAP